MTKLFSTLINRKPNQSQDEAARAAAANAALLVRMDRMMQIHGSAKAA